MFNTVPSIRIGIGSKRLFIGRDELSDCGVPNRMACKLIALLVRIKHQRFQVCIRQHLNADIVVVAEVRVAHPCRSATGRSVRKILIAPTVSMSSPTPDTKPTSKHFSTMDLPSCNRTSQVRTGSLFRVWRDCRPEFRRNRLLARRLNTRNAKYRPSFFSNGKFRLTRCAILKYQCLIKIIRGNGMRALLDKIDRKLVKLVR